MTADEDFELETPPPPAPKPPVVWLAQGMCAFVALASVYFSTKLQTQSVAAVMLGMSVVYVMTMLGLGRRRPWARWLAVYFFGVAALGALGQGLLVLARGSGEPAFYVSSAFVFVIGTIITVHFVLGEPVKAFFKAPPSPARARPGRRRPRSDDPYAEPSE